MRGLAFGALVLATMVARLVLLETGPEIDPDAYAHAMAGRRVLEGTHGVELHWVWLPLWHWLHALALRFGSGIDTMRALNVGMSAIAPVLLVSVLRRPGVPGALPWLAGAVLALSPTLLVHGATSQLEPPVLTLTLAACLAWERKHWLIGILGGLALAAAALIRYEAWAVVLALSLLWVRERSRERAPIWLVPLVAIGAWCLHHRLATGQWFQFLAYNADFAHGYLEGVGYPWGSQPNAPLALLWYVVAVPWIEHAVLAPLSLLGAVWFVRSAPRSLMVAQISMLAFLAIG
ncbi:MAG TPA: hypothetical protein VFB62_02770, partial [Polyangiaceae bacterium]|nr:hypothetical protein [Polyangiaceae bacterium]